MRLTAGCCVTCLLVLIPCVALAGPIPFDSERWEIQAREHRVEEYKGQSSLYLFGGMAWIKDDDFLDGIIEFDVAFSPQRGFSGAVWRMQQSDNFEQFYMRPHQSGQPDANQYTPVFNGVAGWQLYHGEGYGAPVEYRFDEWMHVRIVVSDSRGEVYIDDMKAPIVVIQEMKREVRPGGVGLTASNFAPARFANFSYRKIDNPSLKGEFKPPEPAPEGTVMSWAVSDAFDGKSLDGRFRLVEADTKNRSWSRLAAESTGITNLARVQGIGEGSDTAFARLTITSERQRVKKFLFGYSDRVKVYLNGRLLYGGTNGYRSRDFRYLGTIGLFDEVYLPLEKGANELWLAVSESFGGWGVLARFEDPSGLRLDP